MFLCGNFFASCTTVIFYHSIYARFLSNVQPPLSWMKSGVDVGEEAYELFFGLLLSSSFSTSDFSCWLRLFFPYIFSYFMSFCSRLHFFRFCFSSWGSNLGLLSCLSAPRLTFLVMFLNLMNYYWRCFHFPIDCSLFPFRWCNKCKVYIIRNWCVLHYFDIFVFQCKCLIVVCYSFFNFGEKLFINVEKVVNVIENVLFLIIILQVWKKLYAPWCGYTCCCVNCRFFHNWKCWW